MKGNMRRNIAALAALLLLAVPLAAASEQDDKDACVNGKTQARIAACTRLIKGGHLEGDELAFAYDNRAYAEMDTDDYDAVIADFSQVIKLKPDAMDAWAGRGAAELMKDDYKAARDDFGQVLKHDPSDYMSLLGHAMTLAMLNDLDGAIKEFTHAIELKPDGARGYMGRAAALRDKGDIKGMLADYDKSLSLDTEGKQFLYYERGIGRYLTGDAKGAADDLAKSDVGADGRDYVMVWRYLAAERAGKNGKTALAAYAAKDSQGWPYPFLTFLLGQETQDKMMQAAAQPGKDRESHECQANYYLAEWYLLKDDKAHAKPLLHKAMELCDRESDERADAHVRLLQLGK